MKVFRFALNIWITLASIFSFLVGWVVLAHSPKPVQSAAPAAMTSPAILPPLAPLEGRELWEGGGFQGIQAPSSSFGGVQQPIFRTGGS